MNEAQVALMQLLGHCVCAQHEWRLTQLGQSIEASVLLYLFSPLLRPYRSPFTRSKHNSNKCHTPPFFIPTFRAPQAQTQKQIQRREQS